MEMKSGTLDKWRNYFRTADSNIFDIIEHAIIVAASDCPKELRVRRDRIAEMLFSCKLSRCLGCHSVDLAVPCAENENREEDVEDEEDGGCKSGFDRDDGCEFEAGVSKGSKISSTSRDEQGVELNMNQVSNYSYGDAEALTDEIEEETQIFNEVLRIKEVVDNNQDESEAVLFESLRKLQLMQLSVETLRATGIGKAVTVLRSHASMQIHLLARTLIKEWKDMVDEWYIATEALAAVENTPESGKTSVTSEEAEEEGLPSPPLDEGAFFTTSTMELSQFFDGMDDDGNPRDSGEFHKNRENCRKSSLDNEHIPKRKEHIAGETKIPPKEKNVEQIKKHDTIVKKQTAVIKSNKPSNTESGSGRLTKLNGEGKLNRESKIVQKTNKVTMLRKPAATQQDKLRCSDEAAVQVKLEATKRKLQERYQQAENAKRQRTIQVMEIHDLPKQGLVHKNQHTRHGNHSRHFSYGRH